MLRLVLQIKIRNQKEVELKEKVREMRKKAATTHYYLETGDIFQEVLKFQQWTQRNESTFAEKLRKLDDHPTVLYYIGRDSLQRNNLNR